jgi:hypothetical protein
MILKLVLGYPNFLILGQSHQYSTQTWPRSKCAYITYKKKKIISYCYTSDIQIKYEDKQISIAKETKFLGLFINDNLSWKTHIESIGYKLSSACYTVKSVKPDVTISTLKMIYFSYFHSVMTYGLLFWGTSLTI